MSHESSNRHLDLGCFHAALAGAHVPLCPHKVSVKLDPSVEMVQTFQYATDLDGIALSLDGTKGNISSKIWDVGG